MSFAKDLSTTVGREIASRFGFPSRISHSTGSKFPHPVNRIESPEFFCLLGILVMVNTLFVPHQLRFVLGIPIGFFVPGHCAISLLLGKRLDLEFWPRMLLRVALSMAMYPVLAVSVYTVGGLFRPVTVSGSVAVLCLLSAGFILRRRSRSQTTSQHGSRLSGVGEPLTEAAMGELGQDRPFSALVLVVTVLVAALGLGVAQKFLPHRAPDQYSAFTLVGTWGQLTSSLPIDRSSSISIDVSVLNRTTLKKRYELWQKTPTQRVILKTITIDPGGRWTGAVLIDPNNLPHQVGACPTHIILGLGEDTGIVGRLSIPVTWTEDCDI